VLRTTQLITRRLQNVFYGWWIVVASMACLTVASIFYWQGFSLFFLPLQTEFATSRTALSAAIAFSQLEGGVLGPLDGYLVDRFGPRKMTLIGTVMMGVGFMLMSRVNSLLMFYVVFLGVISIGMGIGIRVPSIVAPSNWFVRKRGLVVGLALTGSGIGGFFLPLLGSLIANAGWRTASMTAGIAILAVGIPAALVMRRRPEDYGLLPDGDRPGDVRGKQEQTTPDTGSGADFTLRQVLRLPVFWLLALAFGLRQFTIGAMQLHQVPNLIDKGFDPQTASTILAAVVVASIVGRLGFGWLADKFPARYIMAVSIGMVAASALLLAYASQWWHLVLYVGLYGIGWGGGAVVMNTVRVAYFGRKSFGTISGMMDFVQMFGLVLGPLFAGAVYDATKSYYIAFITFAIVSVVGGAVVLFLRPPKAPASAKPAVPATSSPQGQG